MKKFTGMRKVLAAASASVVAATALVPGFGTAYVNADAADLTAVQLVEAMGQGWNLGNSFDSANTWTTPLTPEAIETAWHNPVTTEAMIKEIKKSGFTTVRIPITWQQMISSDGTPNSEWLARIKEVVDYCINNDMYAIINTHHDEGGSNQSGWINGTGAKTKFANLWTNIANYFKDYDQHLVFEGMNEEDLDNSTMMTLNQAFVDAVRATGGNNAKRLLLVEAQSNNTDKALDSSFSAPTDSANMIAVSVHYYEPSTFCVATTESTWGHRETWGTSDDYTKLENHLDSLETKFIKNGIPVIIGEYGVDTSTKGAKDKSSMIKFLTEVANYALGKEGMCPVLWDMSVGGDDGTGDMAYFNRKTLSWYDSDIQAIFANASGNTSVDGKKKVDRITFSVSDITESDGSLLIDLKPYKELGVTVNNVLIDYSLAYSGTYADTYGAGGAVQYNVVDSDNDTHWSSSTYYFEKDGTQASVEIPAATDITDDSGAVFKGCTLDMDYLKIENWWNWVDPSPSDESEKAAEEAKVSHKYGDVTVIFSDYIYVDDIGESDPVTTTTAATTAGGEVSTTTTSTEVEPVTGAKGNAYFIGQLGKEQSWSLEDAAGQKTAAVTGDGQYTVEWDLTEGGTDTVQFLAVVIEPVEGIKTFTTDTFTTLTATIDEVWIDGVQLTDYAASEDAVNTRYYEGGSGVTRLYLHNDWTKPNVADLPSKTDVTESVKVVFTVSGVDAGYIEPTTTGTTETKYGDANEDGKINMADAVAVLQNLANGTKYPLTPQGETNADCDGSSGLTGTDARTILRVEAGEIAQSDLPLAG